MITRLHISNFKSWQNAGPFDLRALTGLFGPNSSGKTSLTQLLLALKQTVQSQDRKRVIDTGDDYTYVDIGTFYDFIYNHDASLPLDLSITWRLPEPISIGDSLDLGSRRFTADQLTFAEEICNIDDRLVVNFLEYSFDGLKFGMRREPSNTAAARKSRSLDYRLYSDGYELRRSQGRPWPLPSPIKSYGFPPEAMAYFQNADFLPDLALALENLFGEIAYLGPLREEPARIFNWSGERPVDVGQHGEFAIQALLSARAENLKSGRGEGKGRRYRSIEERILEWLREMGLVASFKLQPIGRNRKDYEFKVRRSSHSPEVNLTDVGFGLSQVLPVLVLCYYAPEGATLILEQPEIHLHPKVQAILADVFIDVINERRLQIILESHSEHLLRRLQRRIAEGIVSPASAKLYFCDTDAVVGQSILTPLDLDEFGQIRNWPADFFGDELGDQVTIQELKLQRQMKAS